ncbi:hypothetical protein NG791_07495 [Laspinema sp. D1]|uniref:hypothetical protein n=1 Tax=Laspinema palackyanum TaxID=3231601 RepID=UPI003498039E|nr:hypothetical protein [Laspinema sp. D2b]
MPKAIKALLLYKFKPLGPRSKSQPIAPPREGDRQFYRFIPLLPQGIFPEWNGSDFPEGDRLPSPSVG